MLTVNVILQLPYRRDDGKTCRAGRIFGVSVPGQWTYPPSQQGRLGRSLRGAVWLLNTFIADGAFFIHSISHHSCTVVYARLRACPQGVGAKHALARGLRLSRPGVLGECMTYIASYKSLTERKDGSSLLWGFQDHSVS